MAFQIIDDLLDYTAQSANLGKDIGDDFFEGKITLPVILSIKQGTEEIQRFWHNTFEKEARASEDLTHAISILENSRAIEASRLRAIEYSTSALTSLNKLPASPLREELEHLTYYVINRLS
jgi:octaprenyl-diphosphate synthase